MGLFDCFKSKSEREREQRRERRRNERKVEQDIEKFDEAIAKLTEERFGWYEGQIDFKRVLQVPGTGKFQYRDTHFVARVKAHSGMDCYTRIVDHLSQRVDARSQFPSAKGKNFKFAYLGQCK